MLGNSDIPYDKPKKDVVSVTWQVIGSLIIPFYWIYALYRVEKLAKGALIYFVMFVGGIGGAIGFYTLEGQDVSPIGGLIAVIGIYGAGIVLIAFLVKWTDEWNQKH